MKRHFPKEDMQMASESVGRCAMLLAVKLMQAKPAMMSDHIPIRTAKVKNSDSSKC